MSILIFLLALTRFITASDITDVVFDSVTDGMPAAFGDFNSDELTDVFVIRDGAHTVEVLLAYEEEPLLRPANLKCMFPGYRITSVVPGDFDGDAFMDVMVTAKKSGENHEQNVYLLWGGLTNLNCTNEHNPLLQIIGQPLVADYNQDMINDLVGETKVDGEVKRAYWLFDNKRSVPKPNFYQNKDLPRIRTPHSNAFIDLNGDYTADLFITTPKRFEIWFGNEIAKEYTFNNTIINIPHHTENGYIGQSLFIDVELIGRLDLITPVCYDKNCHNSSMLVYKNNTWRDMKVFFKDPDNSVWGFQVPDGKPYTETITLRSGDFNMDGYPDLLATLVPVNGGSPQAVFLENIPCEMPSCGTFSRTFVIRWNALKPYNNNTVLAVFYDFYQDGILDLIFVHSSATANSDYKVSAFRNSLDYDANFLKVMVLTGLTNSNNHMVVGNLGKKKRTYGTNLPGPRISYKTTTQEDKLRYAVSAQLPQSAHFSLNLPYTIFGLGRTPNFIDTLTVGLANRSRDWTQIIPNSQMVVIPWPTTEPNRWKAQLFVTPSKLILLSAGALTGICGFITLIILGLYWRERQEDKKERLQESHRFHFDAMALS